MPSAVLLRNKLLLMTIYSNFSPYPNCKENAPISPPNTKELLHSATNTCLDTTPNTAISVRDPWLEEIIYPPYSQNLKLLPPPLFHITSHASSTNLIETPKLEWLSSLIWSDSLIQNDHFKLLLIYVLPHSHWKAFIVKIKWRCESEKENIITARRVTVFWRVSLINERLQTSILFRKSVQSRKGDNYILRKNI